MLHSRRQRVFFVKYYFASKSVREELYNAYSEKYVWNMTTIFGPQKVLACLRKGGKVCRKTVLHVIRKK
jgi:hypothetical protein